MDTALSLSSVTKTYPNGFSALSDVSFDISEGDVVGYIGPNGSGKTTTIKILTNLLEPSSGSVSVLGVDVGDNPKEAMSHIGALIEVPGTYDYLTPTEVLTYFGKVYGMPNAEIAKRIPEVLGQVKLADWSDRKIGGFSTGMLRRFGIAKALLHNPEILILDEPVIGLDPNGMKDVRLLIKDMQEQGKTIFLSSHLLQEMSDTCDSAVFIEKGRIVAQDSIKNILSNMWSKTVEVTLLEQANDALIKDISSIDIVSDVDLNGATLKISHEGAQKERASLLADLVRMGLDITAYVPSQSRLEDYYMATVSDGGM